MLKVDRNAVLRYRARASSLDQRLPPESFAQAASGGLQDSAPRAAVISLHARVDGVTPSSWEDPELCQIWGPRGADYVVPRRDLAFFTLGRMPREPDAAAALEAIADDVHRVCAGEMRPTREVSDALPALGHSIRAGAITGRLLIRWDASKIWVIPVDRPVTDPESARLELARRFLRWFAPTTPSVFSWWSGVEKSDVEVTWKAIASEVRQVEFAGELRFVLKKDEPALIEGGPVLALRLLPHGDPYLKIDGNVVVSDSERRSEIFPRPGVKPAFWPVSGAIMADCEIIGSWARQGRRVTINPWRRLSSSIRSTIEREAVTFPIESGSEPQVRWVEMARSRSSNRSI